MHTRTAQHSLTRLADRAGGGRYAARRFELRDIGPKINITKKGTRFSRAQPSMDDDGSRRRLSLLTTFCRYIYSM